MTDTTYTVHERHDQVHGTRWGVYPNEDGLSVPSLLETHHEPLARAFACVLNGTGGKAMITELRREAAEAARTA